MIRQLTTQHSQEKWREKQVRSTKDVYLHLSRSALNFAAFLAQMSFELSLFLGTPLCLSFLRCLFSPGLRGSCVRNFDQTLRFNKDSCSRVDGRLFFNLLILASAAVRHFVLLNSFMNNRSVAYSWASTELIPIHKNKIILAGLRKEKMGFMVFSTLSLK